MYSHSQKLFSEDEKRMLGMAIRIVQAIDSRGGPGNSPTRCHEVARIVSAILKSNGMDVYVQDGQYGLVDHSWLWTSKPATDWLESPTGYMCPNILDPYCVGSLPQVRLVSCAETCLPHFGAMYQIRAQRKDIRGPFVVEQTLLVTKKLAMTD